MKTKIITNRIIDTEIYKLYIKGNKDIYLSLYETDSGIDEKGKIFIHNYLLELVENHNQEDSLLIPILYKILKSLYHKSIKDFDLEYFIDFVNEKLYKTIKYFYDNFKNIDTQAESCLLISTNISNELIDLNKLKNKDYEKYKLLIRERKLKRIIEQ